MNTGQKTENDKIYGNPALKTEIYGNPASTDLVIQITGEHEEGQIQEERQEAVKLAGREDWCLVTVMTEDWNKRLALWHAPPAFGKEGFGNGAAETLHTIREEIIPDIDQRAGIVGKRSYYLCGYSLAGLFSLWAAYQTDQFRGIAAVSPSVWYPEWISYAGEHQIRSARVYLSLGDKEEKTRNAMMSRVGNAIRKQNDILQAQGIRSVLEWNLGNHFFQSSLRMAKGIAWMLKG